MRFFSGLRAALFPRRRAREDSALEEALAHHEAGRLGEAEAQYRAVLHRDANNARALHLLGVLQHQYGDNRSALGNIRRAVALDPAVALFHFNLGNVLAAMDETASAAEAFARATELDPGHAAGWFNLGRARMQRNLEGEAIAAFRRALALQPGMEAARQELGKALVAFADKNPGMDAAYGEGIALLENHWQFGPDPLGSRMALAHALEQTGRWSDATAHFAAVIAERPDAVPAYCGLGNCYNRMGRMPDAIREYRRALAANPDDPNTASSIVSGLIYDIECTAQALFEEHRRWGLRYADPLRVRRGFHGNERDPDKRLKVGYVSPDFRSHPVTALFLPVLSRHDPAAVETFCYYNLSAADAVTARVRQAAHNWRDIAGASDEEVARRIAEDRIDILVDLAGHTSNGRLLAFARKPAPVQASWLGYFHSTGVAAVDYFVTDPCSSPPGQEKYFVERLARLPHTRFCYEPREYMPESGPLPALERGHVTFGCFNNLAKLNPRVLALWSELLRRLPAARLHIQAGALNDAANRERFLCRLEQEKIGRERIRLLPFVPIEQSPIGYNGVDITLDPFPFCGGMTSFESLWMGVPVVTLPQEILAGRQTASMLANLGLDELAADSPENYVRIAMALARDTDRLAEMRRGLRRRFLSSPLADYASFTRAIESAYRSMWIAWLKGSPDHSAVI